MTRPLTSSTGGSVPDGLTDQGGHRPQGIRLHDPQGAPRVPRLPPASTSRHGRALAPQIRAYLVSHPRPDRVHPAQDVRSTTQARSTTSGHASCRLDPWTTPRQARSRMTMAHHIPPTGYGRGNLTPLSGVVEKGTAPAGMAGPDSVSSRGYSQRQFPAPNASHGSCSPRQLPASTSIPVVPRRHASLYGPLTEDRTDYGTK